MFPPYSASDYGNENGPGVSLVEIEPGVAVVMGDRPLESLGLPAEFDCEVTPFQLMPPGDIQNLAENGPADITIFDAKADRLVDSHFASKAANSPFIGETLKGQVKYTICKGQIVYKN